MPIANKFLWVDLFSNKNETDMTILATLKANQLFSTLNARELKYLAHTVHVRSYEPGEAIFKQYEKGIGGYMIAKGGVEIKVTPLDKPDGEILITTLTAGHFFGELALIDADSKRSASAYAHGPTTLIGFFKPDLLEIMERRPETGVKILFQLAKVLGKRLNETTDLITNLKNHTETGDGKKPS